MKKLSLASFLAIFTASLIISSVLALVANGNFETGDFTGWTKSAFINQDFSAAPGAGGVDLSAIVGGPAVAPLSLSDANTNGVVKYPAYGHYSARVNSDQSWTGGGNGQNANVITQDVTAVLNPDGLEHVRFAYAAVMVDPTSSAHSAEQKPYFRVRLINTSNSNDVIYDFSSYVNEPGKNWQDGAAFGSETWKFIDWTYIDLASSVAHPVNTGDTIKIEVTASGCSLGGHPGYVYVDEITDGDISGPLIQATGPATDTAGASITYTYNYTNGSSSAINPTIIIYPPTNVTFTSLGDSVNCSGLSPVTCTYTGLAAGGKGSFTVTGTVALAAAGTTIAHGNYSIGATGFPTLGGQTVLTDIPALPINTAPVAVDDSYDIAMSETLNGTTVLVNDTDTDLDALTTSLVSGPSHNYGSFVFNSNGTFTYTPVNGYQGTDTFTYKANDGAADSNVATVTINISPITKIFRSNGTNDGWGIESSENSNKAKYVYTPRQLRVGDFNENLQFRSILDFNAGPIPNNAVIMSASLKLSKYKIHGGDPFLTLGNLIVDVKKGNFGSSTALEKIDFRARASKRNIGYLTPSTGNWYQLNLSPTYFAYINLIGHTQFRLRFAIDDNNNNIQDYIRFSSGNAALSIRPQLIIQYYVPHRP